MADQKISALTALTGANVALATDVFPIVDTSVTTTKKITADELGIAINLYKVGTFTRDQTAASGAVAYTGVGFKPKALIIIGTQADAAKMSVGFADGTLQGDVYDNFNLVADSWGVTGQILSAIQGSGIYHTAALTTLDADGFTLTYTKTGSPTGTLTYYYLALR